MRQTRHQKMKAIASGALFLMAAGTACASGPEIWSGFRTITSTNQTQEGLIVKLSGNNVTTNSSCSNTFIVDANDPMSSVFSSALTGAKSAGKSVSLKFISSETSCEVLIRQFKIQ